MRPELETYQLIDKFLNGELQGNDLQSFQQQLHSDPVFAEEVEFQKLTNQVVVGASYDSLRSQMSKDLSKIDSSGNNQKWGLAGIALAVVSIGLVALYSSSTKENTAATQPKAATPSVILQKENQGNTSSVPNKKEEKNIQSATANTNQTITSGAHTETIAPQESIVNPVTVPTTENTKTSENTTLQKSTQPDNTERTIPVDPCLQTSITAKIISNPSCSDASNGSVKIPLSEIKGGTKPYSISFNHSKASGTKELYAYLKADTYPVSISDANGCIKDYSVEVEEKACRTTAFIFAPDKGESWKIDGINNNSYVLTILNMAGRQVFRTNTMQGTFEWQGVSQQGEYLDAGLYIYILEYTNGSKENGQVTIVR